jgi:lysozyme
VVDRQALLADLIEDEGEVLHAYQDPLGFLTIGIGHLIDKRKGGGISPDASRFLWNEDIDAIEKRLLLHAPWVLRLDPVRQRVLYNMAFQLGVGIEGQTGGLLGFRRTCAAIRAGRYDDAAVLMLQSKWGQEDSPERALRLAERMRTGKE